MNIPVLPLAPLPVIRKRCAVLLHVGLIGSLLISLLTAFGSAVYASTPTAGGDTTVVNPVGEGAVSITEDAPQPEQANIRLIVPTLVDPGGGTPSTIRLLSVTGGAMQQGNGGSITLGSSGTVLSLSSNHLDLRFAPSSNWDTPASFQYVVVDPENSANNSPASTATIPITAVNDPPILQTASGDTGDGLAATYYRTAWDLTGPTTSKIDATVNFNSSLTSNDTTVWGVAHVNAEMFSVRWTGQVQAPVTGTYSFSTISDDGVRLWVDGASAIDNWTLHGPTTNTTTSYSWTAGSRHDIRMEYYERGGGEEAVLEWQHTGQGTQVVPQQYLFPATVRPTLTYVTGAGAVAIDDGLTITDVDSPNMASATVTISNNYQSGEDSLGFTNQSGITGSYSNGTLTLSGSSSLANYQVALRSVTYTNSSGSPTASNRTVSFVVNDGSDSSNTTTRDIAFAAVDSPPVIAQGASTSVTMDEDASPTAFAPTLSASDPDNNVMTWSVSTPAGHGTASVSGTGNSKAISYTPTANYNGSDSFVVQVDDGLGGTDTITVNVTISPRNDPPYATVSPSLSGNAHPGQVLTANKGTWSDSHDQTPGTLSYAYQWQLATANDGSGLADIGSATSSTYTPSSNQLGKYLRAKISVSDNGEGLPASQTTVAYTPYSLVANSAPTFTEGTSTTITLDEDNSPTPFTLTLHASDADSDTLTWNVTTPAAHGAAALSGSGTSRTVTYVPDTNYNGTDTFAVGVDDGLGGTATITVSLIIRPRNDAPTDTAIPTITARATPVRVDYTLTANPGTWNDTLDQTPGTLSYTYQWQQCPEYTCATATNITGATESTYTLTPADKGLFLRVKVTATDNGEGLPTTQSTVAYSTSLGQILPSDSTLTANQGQTYATSHTVPLALSAPNILTGATEMLVSENADFAGATWQNYSDTSSYNLSSGDGKKTIYVRFRDASGNVSTVQTTSITLDTAASLAVTSVAKQTYTTAAATITTTSQQPAITGTADPGATVTITIHSDPITGTTTAGDDGSWSWTPDVMVPYGTHEVLVATTDVAGNTRQTTLALVVATTPAPTPTPAASATTEKSATPSPTPTPLTTSAPVALPEKSPTPSPSPTPIHQEATSGSTLSYRPVWGTAFVALLGSCWWFVLGKKRRKKDKSRTRNST